MTSPSTPWQQARLAALDLEGSGAQDRDDEAILEIAVVPITGGQPDTASAYCTSSTRSALFRGGPGSPPA
jgi:DNA polymerase III subunit epsilon